MQFHPLAYMVKLKIEMSMADLIAKIARKKERLPTIHTSITRTPTHALSSPLRSFTRSGNHQLRPLPPARYAVPFRAWNGSHPAGLDSGTGSFRATPAQSALASQGSATMRSPTSSAVDLSSNELFMVQEVTIESEIVGASGATPEGTLIMPILPLLPDGRLPPPDTVRPIVTDESDSEIELPVIWDGTPTTSTVVASQGGLAR